MAGRLIDIPVNTGSDSYNVYIGESILNECLDRDYMEQADHTAVVASRRVYDLHRDYIDENLLSLRGSSLFLMDDSEENKSYCYAEGFLNRFLESGLTRRSRVVGVGGGIVGDFSGYLASLYMRGIPVVHVPTTLLAMVDSSVGGKVAVNLGLGKNIAGAFHQPERVIADLRFLSTLSESEFRNGMAEIVKHGAIGDRLTFDILARNDFQSLRRGIELAELVAASVAFKADIVGRDEREEGIRAILNFGHTAGHAMESFFAYRGISHGEAVATGMVVETVLSEKLGLIDKENSERLLSVIRSYGPDKRIWDITAADVIEHMRYDKKNTSGDVRFVLLKGLFNPVFDYQVDPDMVLSVFSEFFNKEKA